MKNLRRRLIDDSKARIKSYIAAHKTIVNMTGGSNYLNKDKTGAIDENGQKITTEEIESYISTDALLGYRAEESKTVVFPSEQVDVFVGLLERKSIVLPDYNLPFDFTLIEFTSHVEVNGFDGRSRCIGFLLEQLEESKESYKQATIDSANSMNVLKSREIIKVDWSKGDKILINSATIIYEDLSIDELSWTSHDPDEFETQEQWDTDTLSIMQKFKQLIMACIGYINCENIYLQREGEVPEAVNAKRERKGKSRLEPYYVCRIRGVQYDSAGNPTGEGAKHGIRYDVRGHFRRLTTGKTTWVRPHQRGLENELYIPKTYLVDRKEPA